MCVPLPRPNGNDCAATVLSSQESNSANEGQPELGQRMWQRTASALAWRILGDSDVAVWQGRALKLGSLAVPIAG